jgi:hypothetical protein
MPESKRILEHAIRERAYLIWEREGRPKCRADDHWRYATIEDFGDERVRDDAPWRMARKSWQAAPTRIFLRC